MAASSSTLAASPSTGARYASRTLPLGVSSIPGQPGKFHRRDRQVFASMPAAPLAGSVCNGDGDLRMFTADDVETVACLGCRSCTPSAAPVVARSAFAGLPVIASDDEDLW